MPRCLTTKMLAKTHTNSVNIYLSIMSHNPKQLLQNKNRSDHHKHQKMNKKTHYIKNNKHKVENIKRQRMNKKNRGNTRSRYTSIRHTISNTTGNTTTNRNSRTNRYTILRQKNPLTGGEAPLTMK